MASKFTFVGYYYFALTPVSLYAPVRFITADDQGRMKFTRPLYRELFALEETRSMAIQTFRERASFYHPICRAMVAKDLGVELGEYMRSDRVIKIA